MSKRSTKDLLKDESLKYVSHERNAHASLPLPRRRFQYTHKAPQKLSVIIYYRRGRRNQGYLSQDFLRTARRFYVLLQNSLGYFPTLTEAKGYDTLRSTCIPEESLQTHSEKYFSVQERQRSSKTLSEEHSLISIPIHHHSHNLPYLTETL